MLLAFVDLFSSWPSGEGGFTDNGIHLSADGYRQTTHVVTVDGRTVSNILQQQTAKHVCIRDAKDKLYTIPIEDVEEVAPSNLSVMPNGLTEALTPDELVDLASYLKSLGRQAN